jgi:predicted hotdog family 3-hydroxylacyl-ACP dehydratase
MVLNSAGIQALIPHDGAMCLLEEVVSCDEECIVCRAVSHRDKAHPLRDDGILPAISSIEYAAQAMALHGALEGKARGRRGLLAAARDVTFNVERLDDIAEDLIVSARKLIAENGRLLYEFALHAGGKELARGRAAVVLGPGGSG